MSKTIKLISVLLIAAMMVMTVSDIVYAIDPGTVIGNLEAQTKNATVGGQDKVASLAGSIIRFLQYIAIVAGTIILAVLGIKYMMGSVEEKAEYKKSFIPLVVGIVVVMGAMTIARVLFETFKI